MSGSQQSPTVTRETVEELVEVLHAVSPGTPVLTCRKMAEAVAERVADAWDSGWSASELCEAPGDALCGYCDSCTASNPYRVSGS